MFLNKTHNNLVSRLFGSEPMGRRFLASCSVLARLPIACLLFGAALTLTVGSTDENPVVCNKQCTTWFEHGCMHYYQNLVNPRRSQSDAFNQCKWEVYSRQKLAVQNHCESGCIIERRMD